MPEYIKKEDCVDRHLYKIHSRNLSLGVYVAATGGFIGIREKFGDLYLFTEDHYDNGAPYGTVTPQEDLGPIPDDLVLNERQLHSKGWHWATVGEGEAPSVRRDLRPDEPQHGQRQGFVDEWADSGERLPDDKYPYTKGNKPLFDYLHAYTNKLTNQ